MSVGFKNPLHLKLVLIDILDYFLSRRCLGPSRLWVVIQNRVNDGTFCAFAKVDDVGDGPSGFVEDAVNDWLEVGVAHFRSYLLIFYIILTNILYCNIIFRNKLMGVFL